MKIAQLVSNFHNVSLEANQAIYSHVASLTNGLTDLGHDVSLFASEQSNTKAKLISVLPNSISEIKLSEDIKKYYIHLLISKCYSQAKNFDIIHSHFNLLSSFYAKLTDTPTIQSVHSPISEEIKPILSYLNGSNKYISFSLAQRKTMPELNWIGNIYHGVDTKLFCFNPTPKDYFLFIGRITKDKGVHLAIEAAKTANVPLIIAGKSYPTEGYWHEEIEKHIDGKMIRYIGEADFKTKIDLYRDARAVLFPNQDRDEPFGLVMIEAMSCGTPVIGWNRGSVPEIVSNKKTGFVVESITEMVQAIKNIEKISREETRKRAEIYFSVNKMVSGYEKIYKRVIEENKYRKEHRKETL